MHCPFGAKKDPVAHNKQVVPAALHDWQLGIFDEHAAQIFDDVK